MSDLISLIVAKWLQQYQASHQHPKPSRESVSLDKFQENKTKQRSFLFRNLKKIYPELCFKPGWFVETDPSSQENSLGFSQSGPIPRAKDEVVFS